MKEEHKELIIDMLEGAAILAVVVSAYMLIVYVGS